MSSLTTTTTTVWKETVSVHYVDEKRRVELFRYEWEEDKSWRLRVMFHATHPPPLPSWIMIKEEYEEEMKVWNVWNAMEIWSNSIQGWKTSSKLREVLVYQEHQRIFSPEILLQSLTYVLFLHESENSGGGWNASHASRLRTLIGRTTWTVPNVYEMESWKKEGKALKKQYLHQEKKWSRVDTIASSTAFLTFRQSLGLKFVGAGKTKTLVFDDDRPLENIFWDMDWTAPPLPVVLMALLRTSATQWVVIDPSRVRDMGYAESLLLSSVSNMSRVSEGVIEFWYLPLSFPVDDNLNEEGKEIGPDEYISLTKSGLLTITVTKGDGGKTTTMTMDEKPSSINNTEWTIVLTQILRLPPLPRTIQEHGEKGVMDMSFSIESVNTNRDFLLREYALVSPLEFLFRLVDKFPTSDPDLFPFLLRIPGVYNPPTPLPFHPYFTLKPVTKNSNRWNVTLHQPMTEKNINIWMFYMSIFMYTFLRDTTQKELMEWNHIFLETAGIKTSLNSSSSTTSTSFPPDSSTPSPSSPPPPLIPPSTSDLGKIYPELFVKPTYKRFVCQKKQQPIIVSEKDAETIPDDRKIRFPLERIEIAHPIDPQIYTCPNAEFPYPVLTKINAPLLPFKEVYAPCCAKTYHPEKNKEALNRMYEGEETKEMMEDNINSTREEVSEEGGGGGASSIPKLRENRIGKAHIIKSVGQLGALPESLSQWLQWYNLNNEYLRIGHTHGWFSLLHAVEYWNIKNNNPHQTPKSEEELVQRLRRKVLSSDADMSVWVPFVPFFRPSQIRALWEAYFDKKIFLPLPMVARALEMRYRSKDWYSSIVLFYRDRDDNVRYIDPHSTAMRYGSSPFVSSMANKLQVVIVVYVHYGGGMNVVSSKGVAVQPACELVVYERRLEKDRLFTFPADFISFLQRPSPWYLGPDILFQPPPVQPLETEAPSFINEVVAYQKGPMGNLTYLHFKHYSAIVAPGTFVENIPETWYLLPSSPFHPVTTASWNDLITIIQNLRWKHVYVYDNAKDANVETGSVWFITCTVGIPSLTSSLELTFVVKPDTHLSELSTQDQQLFFKEALFANKKQRFYVCETSEELPLTFSSVLGDMKGIEKEDWMKKEIALAVKDITVWRVMLYLKEYYRNEANAWVMDSEWGRPLDTFFRRHIRILTTEEEKDEPIYATLSTRKWKPVMTTDELQSYQILRKANTSQEKVVLPSLSFWAKCRYEIDWARRYSPEKLTVFWTLPHVQIKLPSILESYTAVSLQFPFCNVLSWKPFPPRLLPHLSSMSWASTHLQRFSLHDRESIPVSYLKVRKQFGILTPFLWTHSKEENPYFPSYALVYTCKDEKEALQQWWFWKRNERLPNTSDEPLPLPSTTEKEKEATWLASIIRPIPDSPLYFLILPPLR